MRTVYLSDKPGYFISWSLFRAELFDCLCLKQTVSIANLFDLDLEILFRLNKVSYVFFRKWGFLGEQRIILIQRITLGFRYHLYSILKSHFMSQLSLYRYVFVKRGGGVCSSRVEKAPRMAGYRLFLSAWVLTFSRYTLGKPGYLKQHRQLELPAKAVSRILIMTINQSYCLQDREINFLKWCFTTHAF